MTSTDVEQRKAPTVPRGTLTYKAHPYQPDPSREIKGGREAAFGDIGYFPKRVLQYSDRSGRFPLYTVPTDPMPRGQVVTLLNPGEEYLGKRLYMVVTSDHGNNVDFNPVGRVSRVIPFDGQCVQLVIEIPHQSPQPQVLQPMPIYSPPVENLPVPCPVRNIIERHLPCFFEELIETCTFHEYAAKDVCADPFRQGDIGKHSRASMFQLFFGQMPSFYCPCLMRQIIETHAEVYNVHFEGTNMANHHRHIHVGSHKEVARIHHALHKRVLFDTCGYWYATEKAGMDHMKDFEKHRRIHIRPCIALPMSSLVAELPTRH
ncbi:carboxypeptidase N subunit 2-like protein [Perkinsela sp. CCAP 1560/4]|nr:carboxypeptidase N subunit 2-like protein [Perkinsela sp. CCAP 1560/4]|eukprot:KNH01764.1 carboxypeptidase N subunit 2-like protein [Perkinsela sp. CCAP 1560/4]